MSRHAHPFILTLSSAAALTVACGTTRTVRTADGRAAPTTTTTAGPARPLIDADLSAPGDLARAVREHYTKYDYRIAMRDGVRLYTTVYVPKDRSRTYPMMMTRTPYSIAPYGIDNYPTEQNSHALAHFAPSSAFVREGVIFVHQDVRGKLMSEGTFVDVRPHRKGNGPKDIDESTDAWDSIDWLVKNVPANNGRVGVWGISYPGFYAAQAAVDAHPALKAVSPQAPVTEWFIGDDFHHNGAFLVADAFGFYANFGRARPKPTHKQAWDFETEGDIYDFFLRLGPLSNANTQFLDNKIPFWNDLMEHGSRDAFWNARDPRPFFKDMKPAVLTVGGWYDAEDLWGSLETYRTIERQSPKTENTLVMGPWKHGGWARGPGDRLADMTFGAKTSMFYREKIELPFFQRHLWPGGASSPRTPEAWMFETGTNTWQTYPSWPPKEAKPVTWYFHARSKLDARAPAAGEDASGADSYVSDPAKPVPYDGLPSAELDHDYMLRDQRFASRRPDVLTYSTVPLEADVALAGPLEADLWITTTGTDADFIVKLVDVFPDLSDDPVPNPRGVKMAGYQALVRGEVMRAKFRNDMGKPEPLKPGEPTHIRFGLPDVAHTFRAGHRILVQVQSTWFPLVDLNPQTFVDIYRAKETDFHVATQRILRTPDKPSSLKVTVLRGGI